jgi:hypothetical protein
MGVAVTDSLREHVSTVESAARSSVATVTLAIHGFVISKTVNGVLNRDCSQEQEVVKQRFAQARIPRKVLASSVWVPARAAVRRKEG